MMRALPGVIVNLLAGAAMLTAAPVPQAATSPREQTLRGKLILLKGTEPALESGGRQIMLAGRNSYLFHTLQDKRLADRAMELRGHARPDGFFQVDKLYTLHKGKLYWIRYYCETCNITGLEPGNCVCCQQPTELQEIPVGEPGGPDPKGAITTP